MISDAGTPTISDPGKILIKEVYKKNINIFPIPGPSAVTASVSVSGFSEKFFFMDFFLKKIKKSRKNFNMKSKTLNSSIVFFISAKKLNKIINIIKKFLEDRNIVICKEITKFYEEYIRCKVKDLKPFNNLKGEITIVISELKK